MRSKVSWAAGGIALLIVSFFIVWAVAASVVPGSVGVPIPPQCHAGHWEHPYEGRGRPQRRHETVWVCDYRDPPAGMSLTREDIK